MSSMLCDPEELLTTMFLIRWSGWPSSRPSRLPVTAIASVYGMNTIVNEKTHYTQLGVALALMAAISLTLLRWAHRQGWWWACSSLHGPSMPAGPGAFERST